MEEEERELRNKRNNLREIKGPVRNGLGLKNHTTKRIILHYIDHIPV